jgi:hypothetical protein
VRLDQKLLSLAEIWSPKDGKMMVKELQKPSMMLGDVSNEHCDMLMMTQKQQVLKDKSN